MSKRVGFVSLKGGVGKTCLAVHMAFYIHVRGYDVTLIDGDPIEGCHKWNARGESFPFPVIYPDDKWPADHWLVFDTEAHPEVGDLNALGDTLDLTIIPVTPNVDALDAALMTLPALLGRRTSVLAVVNMAPPSNLPDGSNMREVLEDSGLEVCKTILRKRKAYEYARLEGAPVYDSGHRDAKSSWFEYSRFAKEVLDHGL